MQSKLFSVGVAALIAATPSLAQKVPQRSEAQLKALYDEHVKDFDCSATGPSRQ
jgi:hypothetical protein